MVVDIVIGCLPCLLVVLSESFELSAGPNHPWCCLAVSAMMMRGMYFSTVTGSSSLNAVVFALIASVNVGIEVYIIQCCRSLSMMADVFRCKMIEHSDFVGVVREWNLIHALCREVSRTNQPGVVVCIADWFDTVQLVYGSCSGPVHYRSGSRSIRFVVGSFRPVRFGSARFTECGD